MELNPKLNSEVKVHFEDSHAEILLAQFIKGNLKENTVIICIGTDRCIGDALGPFIGSQLQKNRFRFPLYGTLDDPIHALNLKESVEKILSKHPNSHIIAIDACLGDESLIGYIHGRQGAIYPGKGVGKKLPGVGHISIVGIVDKLKNDDAFAIHNIRLSLVMKMVDVIVDAFLLATYLS
ncbi:MAG: spore protease YyaC [Bacillota bacterium]